MEVFNYQAELNKAMCFLNKIASEEYSYRVIPFMGDHEVTFYKNDEKISEWDIKTESDERELICKVRKKVRDYFSEKRYEALNIPREFDNGFIRIVISSGIFSLEDELDSLVPPPLELEDILV